MHPELQAVVDDFDAASARLQALRDTVPAYKWVERRDPDRWSIAECVAHLNLTSAAFVPLLRGGLDEARRSGHRAPTRYRRDPIGWLLWWSQGPPVKFRVKTTAPFVPRGDRPAAELVEEFARLQREQVALAREADGLAVHRVRIASPFDTRVRYSVYSALTILPRHQHRHLWQAEQVVK